jgi:hypothetical protein
LDLAHCVDIPSHSVGSSVMSGGVFKLFKFRAGYLNN